jgi:lipoyl-dependent peroxiredoxin
MFLSLTFPIFCRIFSHLNPTTNKKMEKLYTAVVTARGGRTGTVKSSDGLIDFQLGKPAEMGGKGDALNPELLFAAAYGACYGGSLEWVANSRHIELGDYTVETHISFNQDGNGVALSGELHVHLPGMDQPVAAKLAHLAHVGCLYSKAVKGGMEVNLIVNGFQVDTSRVMSNE